MLFEYLQANMKITSYNNTKRFSKKQESINEWKNEVEKL